MCHHRGDIPEEMPDWTMEREETDEDEEALPEFLNDEGEEVSVLTDGSGGD
jgi:hypothetical protein